MAEFISRLAERALGVAPVVQPLIASMFAPEPTGRSLDLEWDSEATTSSGAPDWVQSPPAVEPLPTRDAPKGIPEDTAMVQREEQDASARITTSPPTSGTSDISPDPHTPTESGPSERRITRGQEDRDVAVPTEPNHLHRMPEAAEPDLSEDGVAPRQEDQRNSSSTTPGSFRKTPESRLELAQPGEPGSLERRAASGEDRQNLSRATMRRSRTPPETRPATLHRAEPGPTQRDALSTSPRALPESLPFSPPSAGDESGQAVFRPISTLGDHGQGATLPPVPSPGTESPLDANGGTSEPEATLAPPAVASPVTPRMVRPQPNGHLERGSREPRVAAPGPPAPTIRVAIGRIEVRAITPPPTPPAQRDTPARPSPALSLDDYLKQRNRGQR
jgi:hypothetical protein